MENYDPPYNTPWPSDESTNYYGGNSGNSYYEGGWIPVDGRPVNPSTAESVFPEESTEYPTDLRRSPAGYFFPGDNLTGTSPFNGTSENIEAMRWVMFNLTKLIPA